MLVGLVSGHRGPLTADFRRYYQCSLSDALAGGVAPLADVAAWAAHLPPESATARSLDPHWQRTPQVDLLREVEFRLRILAWMQTVDGSKGRNVPDRLALPWDARATDVDVHEWDDLADALGGDPRLVEFMARHR